LFICLFGGRSFSVFEGSGENGVAVVVIENHHIFVSFIRVNCTLVPILQHATECFAGIPIRNWG
jgi:hypothetical protein